VLAAWIMRGVLCSMDNEGGCFAAWIMRGLLAAWIMRGLLAAWIMKGGALQHG
jgi:predicted Co/Zn/Cd cation transporter (cation efflux family)